MGLPPGQEEDGRLRLFRQILVSLLGAALTSLAAWIITVNLYVTSRAFAHAAAVRASAFRAGFMVAGGVGAMAFFLALYLQRRGRPRP